MIESTSSVKKIKIIDVSQNDIEYLYGYMFVLEHTTYVFDCMPFTIRRRANVDTFVSYVEYKQTTTSVYFIFLQ